MKDFQLPIYSNKEKEEMFKNLKEGDLIVQISLNSWLRSSYNIYYRRVKKRTPKGSIRLNDNSLIKYIPDGNYVLNEEVKACIEKVRLENYLEDAIHKIEKNFSEFMNEIDFEKAKDLKKVLEKLNLFGENEK